MLMRFWLLLAQVVTIAVGALLAWKAVTTEFGIPQAQIVTVREEGKPPPPLTAPHSESFRAAVQKALPSVVNIYMAKAVRRQVVDPRFPYFYREQDETATSLGSGVVISDAGYVLTNNHVIESADEIAVALGDGRIAKANVVGTDPETDLAVLRISADRLRPISFGVSEALQVGDVVLAIGNPFGVGQTVTQGIVSATGRQRLGINTFENFIQTDAAINPGNSGGALIDARGTLVGINTAIFSESGGSQGIGFAIPVSLARQVMEQIISKGRVDRGWLGVAAQDTESDAAVRGARIMGVQRGGPADGAGLRPGDVIVAINDKPIADTAALINTTAALAPGARGEFKIRRNGKEIGLQIEVGRRPPQPRSRAPR